MNCLRLLRNAVSKSTSTICTVDFLLLGKQFLQRFLQKLRSGCQIYGLALIVAGPWNIKHAKSFFSSLALLDRFWFLWTPSPDIEILFYLSGDFLTSFPVIIILNIQFLLLEWNQRVCTGIWTLFCWMLAILFVWASFQSLPKMMLGKHSYSH